MNPSTINNSTFTVKQGETSVPGTVGYSGNTATFTPSNVLTAGLIYTATITTGAKDLAGNSLAANIVWSFTTGSNTSALAVVSMSTGVGITLTGGALAKNIFWQVAGESTLGPNSHFEGIILSKKGIAFQTGATINGRALAQTQVTLDKNTVTQPQ